MDASYMNHDSIGRLIRRIVDEHLNHGDGSGERHAREKLNALADQLDPMHRRLEAWPDVKARSK